MTTTLYAIVCAAICLRVVFFRRCGGSHRPLAALIAYVIAAASGTEALRACLGQIHDPGVAAIALQSVLLLALVASRGNVADLFHTPAAENFIHRIIRRIPHAQG
ncbi:MAG: phage holin family protein [Pseudomonadota bacterium]